MTIERFDFESKDLAQSNIEEIGELFPGVITEEMDENGLLKKSIDFDKLMAELRDDVVEKGKERYEFTWPGKRKAIAEANKPIRKTLRPVVEDSKDWDNTENLYIEGDNLEVLKILQESYLGKVKMIYIDPPYNTGNDFVYNDSYEIDSEKYKEMSDEFNEENEKLLPNPETNGRFHSNWCSMIYPRLKLARNLLSDDGVIFISIDDNEQDNLKKICSEVFGEGNLEVFIWNKEAEGSSGTLKQVKRIRRVHEYILVVYKNKEQTEFYKIREALKGKENKLYTANLAVNLDKEDKEHENYFTITNEFGDKFTRQWKWGRDEIKELINNNLIYWGKQGRNQPRLIIPTDDRRRVFMKSMISYGGDITENDSIYSIGGTTVGNKELEEIFGIRVFDNPKPVILIRKFLETTSDKDEVILDFFSGSATTAHAVMDLNAEDGGKRKYIMVQLPEATDEKSEAFKAGYKNICEIGKERIRRAREKILEDNKDKEGIEDLDTGFRVFRVDSTNMKDVYFTPDVYEQNFLLNLQSNIKEDRNDLDLLFACLLDWGLPIDRPYTVESVGSSKIHIYNHGDLVACFSENLSENIIKRIANLKPLRAVFRDSSFGASEDKINVEEIFKVYSPETDIRVL